ncbi:type II toxin-antitoxin system VapC family toxin [Moraxella sp. ZY210820]|uniref:type II toxin-antitoxin system VapC family toxin n=1 Tax=unclassified Moraxella TaxID=2685852 RepID=UPI00272FF20C|nr:type II toxin-antitoxin system VapC family toxin [Moraxella sp. ZY210820]WLF83527.1 type II toxin-antitoxin system VapC family toxin [Moraxella sp. ZY210820]
MKNNYIIDTHIFLWLIFNPSKINSELRVLLECKNNQIFICNTSFWEISIKYNLGKLNLEGILPNELPKIALQMGIDIIQVNHEIMANFYKLPKVEKHKEPFDRIMIYYCIYHQIPLISIDDKFNEYKLFGLNLI